MAKVDVKVPDIGDFNDVPVIEVLVKPGDVVKAEQSLITLESDKATMDVPSPVEGTVAEVVAKVGDKVSMGTLIARIESGEAGEGRGRCRQEPRHRTRKSCRAGEGPYRGRCADAEGRIAELLEVRGDRHHNPRHRRLQGRAGHRDSGEGRRYGRGGAADRNARIRQGEHGRAVARGRQDHGDCRQGRRQGVDGFAGREARRRRIGWVGLVGSGGRGGREGGGRRCGSAPNLARCANGFAAPAAEAGIGPRPS